MLCIQQVKQVGRSTQVDLNRPGAVAVVCEQFVARHDVVSRQVGAPPAGRDADLRISTRNRYIEGLRLQFLPDIHGHRVALLASGIALGSEAIVAAPVDLAKCASVRPNGNFYFNFSAATFNPYIFCKVKALYGVSTTSEEQVLSIHIGSQVGAGKVQFDVVGAVTVINHHLRHEIG